LHLANKKAGDGYHPTFTLAEPANFTVLGQEDNFSAGGRQA
jgi:hypothetical protein